MAEGKPDSDEIRTHLRQPSAPTQDFAFANTGAAFSTQRVWSDASTHERCGGRATDASVTRCDRHIGWLNFLDRGGLIWHFEEFAAPS
jgi:hypothetical protein